MKTKSIYNEGKELIVSEDGRIFLPTRTVEFYSPKRNKVVSYTRKGREGSYNTTNSGYIKSSRLLVHRAVAEAFLEKPKGWEDSTMWTVNHKDGNKLNNHYTNLEWLKHKDNIGHWLNSDLAIEQGKLHPIEVRTVDGNFIGVFRAKKDAATALNVHKSTITYCIQGKFKQSGGYTFREISKEEYYAKKETDN